MAQHLLMKLGVFTVLFQGLPLERALDTVRNAGLDAVEIGTGGYPGTAHCQPDALLHDDAQLAAFRQAISSRGLQISALSCHANPLHPRPEIAAEAHATFESTVRLAAKLGVDRINLFSGCPGDSDQARYPNWVTAAWPPEYQELLAWQWAEKVIPYWRRTAAFASQHGIRLGFEMHPGFVVYNPETLLRLRSECGDNIGANLDPSHLFWQGIDVTQAVRVLGKAHAIFHVHAKDTAIDPHNAGVNGVLDTKPLGNVADRSWIFRTVGYGHDELFWATFVSTLRKVGYDDVLSIEHEDALASIDEGFIKGVHFLRRVMLTEQPAAAWWV
jgi:sugar phosphate isomerase/epimerase